MTEDTSGTFVGPVAIVEGRAALILSQILAGSLRNGMTLRRILADFKPVDQEAALRAELALEDAGHRWRIAQHQASSEIRGKKETRGNDESLPCEAMSTRAAAAVIGRTPRRVVQLVGEGVLSATRTPRGYALDRREVFEYAKGLGLPVVRVVAGGPESPSPTPAPLRSYAAGGGAA